MFKWVRDLFVEYYQHKVGEIPRSPNTPTIPNTHEQHVRATIAVQNNVAQSRITTPMGEAISGSLGAGGWTIPRPGPLRLEAVSFYGDTLNYVQPIHEKSIDTIFSEFTYELSKHNIQLDNISLKDPSYDRLFYYYTARNYGIPNRSDTLTIVTPSGRVNITNETKHLIAKYSIEMENVPD